MKRLIRAGRHFAEVELPDPARRREHRPRLSRMGSLHLRRANKYIAEALADGDQEQLAEWTRLRELILSRAK